LAAGSQIWQQGVKFGSREPKWQQGIKFGSRESNIGRLSRALKEQSWKNHVLELQYLIPMRIVYENSPSLLFFLLPAA
jgi:hypothetical protein